MRALVVGGTGPSGPFIMRGLAERGYEVTMYHRGDHEVDEPLPEHEHLHGDPFTEEAFSRDMAGRQWDLTIAMYGRLRVIAGVLAGKTRRLVGITGGRALVRPEHLPYPGGLELPLSEEHPTYTDRNVDEFGFAVANGERAVLGLREKGEFEAVIVRYTMVYGPRAPRQWLAPIVKRALDGRRSIIVPGDGTQFDRVLYAENAAQLVLLAGEREEANGRIFNAVDAATFPIRESIRIAGEAVGHQFEVVGISHPLAYELSRGYAPALSRQFSTAPQKALLGYQDATPPQDAIGTTVRWLAAHPELIEAEASSGGGNPYAYEIEDQLIASFRAWQRGVDLRLPAGGES